MTYDATVVIGTLNRPQIVLLLLNQLVKDSRRHKLEVLVYDQSERKSHNILAKAFPHKIGFHLFALNPPNTCRYLNLGWQQGSAPIILYLDDDVTLTPNTISSHLKNYHSKSTMAVAGRVINADEKISEDHETGVINWYGAVIKSNFSALKKRFVMFPYGCNMSFRQKKIKEIGGFDEQLKGPIYSYNEVDLGYRLSHRHKSSILFEPEALVYHKLYPSGGTRTYSKESLYRGNNFNYGYFLGKNFNYLENVLCLFRRLPYQLLKEPTAMIPIIQGMTYAKSKNR